LGRNVTCTPSPTGPKSQAGIMIPSVADNFMVAVVTHVGMLNARQVVPSEYALPCVEATPVPRLIPCEKRVQGDTRTWAVSLTNGCGKLCSLRIWAKDRENRQRSYYACTMTDCGWSGSGRARHAKFKPRCPGVPCTFVVEPSPQVAKCNFKEQAARFVARCTATQVAWPA
jgi:hypothetical protein